MRNLYLLLLLSCSFLGFSQSKTTITDSTLTFVNNNEYPNFEVLFNNRIFDLHDYIKAKDSTFKNIEFEFLLLIGPGVKARLDLKQVKSGEQRLIFTEEDVFHTKAAFMLYECEIKLKEAPAETVTFTFPIKFDL